MILVQDYDCSGKKKVSARGARAGKSGRRPVFWGASRPLWPLLALPASAGSLSTGKGTSCGPLVCLCYTRVTMHGRSFPSARVMVVVLPMPFALNVFPSVEPITIVNVCIHFAGFEQN